MEDKNRLIDEALDLIAETNDVNEVVKALVEATPISGPARVINTRSDSLTNELSGTLQIANE